MLSRTQKCLVVGILALFPLSCTQLPEWEPPATASGALERLPTQDSVPLKWGNLVSVSTTPGSPYMSQLWFQDEQGNLRMVNYDMRSNNLWMTARFIPRK